MVNVTVRAEVYGPTVIVPLEPWLPVKLESAGDAEAVQPGLFVVDHETVVVCPVVMLLLPSVSDTVGAPRPFALTITELLDEPAPLVQVSVNWCTPAAAQGPTDLEPDEATLPVQLPSEGEAVAEQDDAPVEDQVSVLP